MKTRVSELIPGDSNNFEFELIDIQQYDHERLLSSNIPEEILLAVLGDFQNESPEAVVAKVTKRLLEASQDVTKLQRYIRQLVVMSKLRNLQEETLLNIEKMPFDFDIETDVIYQRGKQEGKLAGKNDMIIAMLRDGTLASEKIAAYAHVSVDYVKELQQQLNA